MAAFITYLTSLNFYCMVQLESKTYTKNSLVYLFYHQGELHNTSVPCLKNETQLANDQWDQEVTFVDNYGIIYKSENYKIDDTVNENE